MEFIQNIVYAPSSVKVVFRGSEQTAMIGMIFLCMSKMCHINTGYREHALNMECNYITLCIKYMSVRTDMSMWLHKQDTGREYIELYNGGEMARNLYLIIILH